ncbi:MAG: NUDIX domain-containing protein [Gemmatimonadaceae bacterium]
MSMSWCRRGAGGSVASRADGVLSLDRAGDLGTLRHTRYQAAVLQNGAILLLRCAFRNGPTVWILPGGGREDGEDEEACVAREVREETHLDVRVERLLSDRPAEPPDGTYIRWRTYLCTVTAGKVSPGGGEGADAELVAVTWLPIHDERTWSAEIWSDAYLYPQLLAIRAGIANLDSRSGSSAI